MNRCCIYALDDQDGVIDDYVFQNIKELYAIAQRIVVVVNGKCKSKCYERIKASVDEVICRGNHGFDGEAFREVIIIKKEK